MRQLRGGQWLPGGQIAAQYALFQIGWYARFGLWMLKHVRNGFAQLTGLFRSCGSPQP